MFNRYVLCILICQYVKRMHVHEFQASLVCLFIKLFVLKVNLKADMSLK